MTMFSRTWAVPYVLARQELETILREYGFSLAAEALLPEAAGSAWAEYRRPGARIRLEWDGTNHWLRLQSSTAGAQPATHQWEDIEVLLREVPRAADADRHVARARSSEACCSRCCAVTWSAPDAHPSRRSVAGWRAVAPCFRPYLAEAR